LEIKGTTANTRTGNTTVNTGTLQLDKTPGMDAIASGTLTINSGATLLLNASHQLGSGVNMVLTAGSTLTSNHAVDTLGTLTLTGSTTINLVDSAPQYSTISFANSSGTTWTPSVQFKIYGWSEQIDTNGIFFGSDMSGLTTGQLSEIVFHNPAGYPVGDYPSIIEPNGRVRPVPEPATYVVSALLLAIAGFEFRRLRRRSTTVSVG